MAPRVFRRGQWIDIGDTSSPEPESKPSASKTIKNLRAEQQRDVASKEQWAKEMRAALKRNESIVDYEAWLKQK